VDGRGKGWEEGGKGRGKGREGELEGRGKVGTCSKVLGGIDAPGWPYDKTYDTQSFVGHENYDDPRLNMSHSGCVLV